MKTPLIALGLVALPAVALGPLLGNDSVPVPTSDEHGSDESPPEGSEGLTQAGLEQMAVTIRADVEELRGVEFLRDVEVVLTDLEGFQAYVERRIAELQTPEDLRAEEQLAKLLGIVPLEMDLMAATKQLLDEQVGGFYDPSGEAFYLLDRYDGPVAGVFMAHELTHALDDQLYDIDGTLLARDGNADAQSAYHAVVEGSGTSIQTRWMMAHMNELLVEGLEELQVSTPSLSEAPPFVWKPLLAAYMRGASFLVRSDSVLAGQMQVPTAEDIDVAFRQPPASTEQILHPEKYWEEEQRDVPSSVGFELGALPEGWEVLREDTLGELGLSLVTWPLDDRGGLDMENSEAVLHVRYTHAPSMGWGGDRVILLERDGALFLRLATAWDTPEDAEEFASSLGDLTEHLSEIAKARGAGGEHSGATVVGHEDTRQVVLTIAAGIDVLELPGLLSAVQPVFE
jgi:hypothetical protein